jgi:hypothetical protein
MTTDIFGHEVTQVFHDDLDERAHVMETFGPLTEDDLYDAQDQVYHEGHYYDTLRNFEELIEEYGAKRVLEDLDSDVVGDLENALQYVNQR